MKPETRAFLELVRDAEAATAADEARVERMLRAAIERGAGASVDETSTNGWLGTGGHGVAGLGAKLSMIACTLALGTSEAPRAPTVPRVPVAAATAPREITPPPLPTAAPAPPVSDAGAARRRQEPRRAPSLRAELELLERVQGALRRGDGEAALRELAGHRSADRTLRAEREAARILALCLAGKEAAAQAAALRFLREHPGSLQRDAIATSCANPSRKGAR
jgi:hypothetical protein